MKHVQLVALYPCPRCGLEWKSDEYYSCWRVRCRDHGIVMDHGSLGHGAYSIAMHRKEHRFSDLEVVELDNLPKV